MQRRRLLLGSLALLFAAACGGAKPAPQKPARSCPYNRPASGKSRRGRGSMSIR